MFMKKIDVTEKICYSHLSILKVVILILR